MQTNKLNVLNIYYSIRIFNNFYFNNCVFVEFYDFTFDLPNIVWNPLFYLFFGPWN